MLPNFSVIIPVKNRGTYIEHTIKTCLIQKYKNFEIIVSDDNSDDNTGLIVEQMASKDSRIKYFRHDTSIGMRENFEFALNQIKPGYVIALGGDDGLLPNGISNMWKVLRATNKEMLTWPASLYSFPEVNGKDGQIVIYHDKGVKIINSNKYLDRQSKNLYYLTDKESPMFYVKGVVSTELIDRVKSRSTNNQFYSCPTPDGYSGIVLAGEVESYAYSGEPFSLYGMSSSSQGLAYQKDDRKSKIESDLFLKISDSTPMHRELASQPYSPLITLMTVDYLLTAKDLPGWNGDFTKINFKKVIIKALNELCLGVYGVSRIKRELEILRNISKYHGLESFFEKKIKHSKKMIQNNLFDGNGISPSVIYLNAKPFQIDNIFDAAFAVKNIYQFKSQISLNKIISSLINSIKYKLLSKRKGNEGALENFLK